ncbi:unnamed protein product, partial [Rotaria sordida]
SHLYSWESSSDELNTFLSCQLFSFPIRSTIHNIQGQFKSCDAPSYDPTQMMYDNKFYSHETWSLQDAIIYTFAQYLSKRETSQRWPLSVDVNLCTRDISFFCNYRQKLIKYACLDCTLWLI